MLGVVLIGTIAAALGWRLWRTRPELTPRGDAAQRAANAGRVALSLRGLPADAWAIAVVADFTAFRAGLSATALSRAVTDPDLAARARAAVLASAGEAAVADLDHLVAGLAEIDRLGLRSLVLAIVPLATGPGTAPQDPDRDPPAGLVAIAACDDPARAAAWLGTRLARPGDPGDETTGNDHGIAYTCSGEVCRAVRANTVLVGTPRQALLRLLATPESEEGLSGAARLRRGLEATAADPAGLFLFADLRALLAAGQDRLASAEARDALAVLGAGGLDSAALAQTPAGNLFVERALLSFEPQQATLLAALLEAPPARVEADRYLPAGIERAWVGRLPELTVAWDRLLAHARKLLPAAEAERIEQSIAQLRLLTGVDLRDDILAALGGEFAVGWSPAGEPSPAEPGAGPAADPAAPGPASATRARFAAVVGLRDPARLGALLARAEGLAQTQGIEVSRGDLAGGTLWSATLPLGGGPTAAVALVPGRLAVGLSADELRAAFAVGATGLAGEEPYKSLRLLFPFELSALYWNRRPGAGLADALAVAARTAAGLAERQRVEATAAALAEVGAALAAYTAANGTPPPGEGLSEVLAALGTGAQGLPDRDGWGNPLGYASRRDRFLLWSPGSDAALERDWTGCLEGCDELLGETAGAAEDLVQSGPVALRRPGPLAGRAPGAPLPPAWIDLLAAARARLGSLAPAMGTLRCQPGLVTWESRTSVPSLTPGLLLLGAPLVEDGARP